MNAFQLFRYDLLWVLLLLTMVVHGQDAEHKFGVVSKFDFDYAEVPFDPEAEAVVLFDIGESKFDFGNDGYTIYFDRVRRIKVLTDAGVSFATATIPYYQDGYGRTETIEELEAITFNMEDGVLKREELSDDDLYEVESRNNWKYKRLAFKNVKKGSVIDLHYTIQSPFLYNLPDWEFQSTIPTLYSKCIVRLVPYYEYAFVLQGAKEFDFHDVGRGSRQSVQGVQYYEGVHTMIMNNVPAFKDEQFITSESDYIMKIDFQLSKFHDLRYGEEKDIITTWPLLIEDLLKREEFGKYKDKCARVAQEALAAIQYSAGDQLGAAHAMVDYVKNTYRWNGEVRKYAKQSPKELAEARSGNSAELNLFLTVLLNEAGIEAYPVLISTRDHGKVKTNYPFESFFNNVIVYVRGRDFNLLTDATSQVLPFNRIPEWCINEYGLVINPSEETWLELSPGFESAVNHTLTIDCDVKNGLSNIAGSFRYTEYEAASARLHYRDTSDFVDMLSAHGITDVSGVRVTNLEEIEKPLSYGFKGTAELSGINDNIVLAPFLGFPPAENPLKQDSRTYPVDFVYPLTRNFTSIITIPEGYTIETLPENMNVDDDLVKLSYNSSSLGDKLKITGAIQYKKGVYPPEEYVALRSHLDEIVAKFNEYIILSRL